MEVEELETEGDTGGNLRESDDDDDDDEDEEDDDNEVS